MSKITPKQARRELWRRGDLSFLLHSVQLQMRDILFKSPKKISTVLASRRIGKTWLLLVMSSQLCNSKPGTIIKYICPKQKQGQSNIIENMLRILEDCPEEMRPEWKEQKKQYEFPNGSIIQVAGTDNGNHENLRGGRADMCIVDEAGFCDHLGYVVRSVLRPTIATTGGRIFLISTPSRMANHEFVQQFVKPAIADKTLIKFTLKDNPLIDAEEKERIKEDYPQGENDPEYLREYFCEIIQDEQTVVVPEFTEAVQLASIQPAAPPHFCDYYVSGDIGFKDLTVFLFGYYDFRQGKVVVMDELVFRGAGEVRTDKMAEAIKAKERALFVTDDGEYRPPTIRVMDNDLKLINDLASLHQLYFTPTAKDNKEAQVNELRLKVAQKGLQIDPKCKTLIYHLQNASWDSHRKSFERMPDSSDKTIRGGHADAVDALIYMVRNILYFKNPYPHDFDVAKGPNIFRGLSRMKEGQSELAKAVKSILNIRK